MLDAATYSLLGQAAEVHLDEFEQVPNYWAKYGRIIDARTGGSKYRMKPRATVHVLDFMEEGAAAPIIEPAEGSDIFLYAKEFGGQYLLTDKLQEDASADGDPIELDTLVGAMMSGWETMASHFNHFLQHGFSLQNANLGMSGGDGVPRFSASHPIRKGSTDYNNNLLGAIPMTPSNLATARSTLAQLKTPLGREIGNLRELVIFCGENYRARAVECVGGPTIAYSAALTPNVFGPGLANTMSGLAGVPTIEVLPFWTSANGASGWEWVVAEAGRMRRSVRCKLTRAPRLELDRLPNSRLTNPTISGRAAYGDIVPTWAVGANPASDTAP